MVTIPNICSRKVKLLLDKIGSKYQPEYVPCQPWQESEIDECFENVKRVIEIYGGNSKVGYAIWQSDFILEAEYHAIWIKDNGELIDITKHTILIEKILFVEDDRIPYKGQHIDNIRLNRSGSIIVEYLIKVCEALFYLRNCNDRLYRRELKLVNKEADLYKYLEMMKRELEVFIKKGNTESSICFCQRGKTFFSCHMEDISNVLNEIQLIKRKNGET